MRRNKYRNIRTTIDGIKFASKREARYYSHLVLVQRAGSIKFFLRQVPIYLPGGVKYVVDFVEFWKAGDVRFIDVKGYKTPTYRLKKKQVEALYPIKILEF